MVYTQRERTQVIIGFCLMILGLVIFRAVFRSLVENDSTTSHLPYLFNAIATLFWVSGCFLVGISMRLLSRKFGFTFLAVLVFSEDVGNVTPNMIPWYGAIPFLACTMTVAMAVAFFGPPIIAPIIWWLATRHIMPLRRPTTAREQPERLFRRSVLLSEPQDSAEIFNGSHGDKKGQDERDGSKALQVRIGENGQL